MAEETPARTAPALPSARQTFSRTVMFMMVFLTLFVFLDANFRTLLANGVGAVMGPTLGMGAAFPVITILLAGTLTTVISSIVRHIFTDWVRMTRMNKEVGAIRKAQMEALRRGNPGKVQKLRQLQRETQAKYLDVTTAPLKSMAFTFLLFIVLFTWVSKFVYVDAWSASRLLFAVPWQTQANLEAAYVLPAWLLLYSLLAIPIGQLVTRGLRYLQFRKRLADRGAEAPE